MKLFLNNNITIGDRRFGCGCSCPAAVQYASAAEVARQNGNTLVLIDVHSQEQVIILF
jgi:hypothetical protein